jgi:hypothetical protein
MVTFGPPPTLVTNTLIPGIIIIHLRTDSQGPILKAYVNLPGGLAATWESWRSTKKEEEDGTFWSPFHYFRSNWLCIPGPTIF